VLAFGENLLNFLACGWNKFNMAPFDAPDKLLRE
jgi:hypothetical protein